MKVQDIRHVGLLSSAIAAHGRFYREAWGLQAAGEDRHGRYYRGSSTEHHILSLHPADRRGLHHLAFSLESGEAIDAAATELERLGTTIVAQPDELDEPGGGYGLRFLDPETAASNCRPAWPNTRTAGLLGESGPAGSAT